MIKEIHIFDFDGTLVNSEHRYRVADNGKIDLDFWIANENLAWMDKPIEKACSIFRAVRDSVNKYAIIATARIWCDGADLVCRANDLVPDSLVSRSGRSDNRGGSALKIAHVDRLLNLRQFRNVETIHVYEDNVDYMCAIADHYENKGFCVVCHYHPSEQGY